MGARLTRGNLLATLKELKKLPRPKMALSAPSVQAICEQKLTTNTNKSVGLDAVMKRRRAMIANSSNSLPSYMDTNEFKLLDAEFNVFIADYISNKNK